MIGSASSLDSETLDDPFPSASSYVAGAHQFLRENFQSIADFLSAFTSDFLAFSDFQVDFKFRRTENIFQWFDILSGRELTALGGKRNCT